MQVVGEHGGLDTEEPCEVPGHVPERPQRLGVGEVPEVRREERAPPPGQADGALHLRAEPEDRARHREPQRHRLRRVPPRAAHRQFGAAVQPDHRVLGAHVDRPVVGEEPVHQRAEPGRRVGVVHHDRLVGEVPAGQDERHPELGGEQVVQRGVGEHDAEVAVAGRDGIGDGRPGPAAQQRDRPAPRREHGRRRRADDDELRGVREVGRHHRERLLLAVLARPQAGHRGVVVGPGREVVAADPLDREHRAVTQEGRRPAQRGVTAQAVQP